MRGRASRGWSSAAMRSNGGLGAHPDRSIPYLLGRLLDRPPASGTITRVFSGTGAEPVPGPASMTEAGYFDVDPASNNNAFNGTWANYPFFNSGIVIVNSIERGLFVL